MQLTVGTSELNELNGRLRRAGRSLDKKTLGPALLNAARPALNAVRQEAPVGEGYERVSLSHRRGRRNDYRRGGATQRDVRQKLVDGVGDEVVRVLEGVSKKRGKVGWRTHFITFGTRFMRANPFIDRAVNRTLPEVISRFMGSVRQTVDRILTRL